MRLYWIKMGNKYNVTGALIRETFGYRRESHMKTDPEIDLFLSFKTKKKQRKKNRLHFWKRI